MAIGHAIGIGFGKKFDWSSYWASLNPDFWVKKDSRSGLTLTDSINSANSPAILPSYLYKPTGDETAIKLDNGALDIAANDKFTYYQWVKGEDSTGGVLRYFGGKLIFGSVNGRYGFWCSTDDKYACQIHPSGGLVSITSTVLQKDVSPHLLLMEIDQTAHLLRFFIDNVQIGVDTSFTGTFSALSNVYGFIIGGGNESGGGIRASVTAKASYSDGGVVLRILTPTEKTTLFNRGNISNQKAHWPMLLESAGADYGVMTIHDASGNGYHLTGSATLLSNTKVGYGSFGSRHGLDVGYTLYDNGLGEVYIPYLDSGTELVTPTVRTGYKKVANFPADTLNHNLSNSKIRFAAGTIWDRSNATNYSDPARLGYYDAGNVTDWHITELNNLLNQAWANAGHKKSNFVKISDHSYKTRRLLEELATFSSELSDSNYSKVLLHFGDYVYVDTYENDHIYWKYDAQNIVASRDTRVLKFTVATNTVSLSIDSGVTYPYSKAVAGLTMVQFAYICANGDIAFASGDKIYRSIDNLTTVTEIGPTGSDGNPYVPVANENYSQVGCSSFMDEAVGDPIFWGNYSNAAGIMYDNINIWGTVDNFATIKSYYKFGTPNTDCKHIHNITKHPDGYFVCHTGDGQVGTDARWLKIVYNDGLDTITLTELYSGDNTSKYFASGIGYNDSNVYWCTDGVDYGVHKVAEADLGTPASFVNIFPTKELSAFLLMESDGQMIASIINTKNQIITSNDAGDIIKANRLYGTIPSNLGYWTIRPKNSAGWYFMQLFEATEGTANYYLKGVMWIKIK
jgi:hypothetical protein